MQPRHDIPQRKKVDPRRSGLRFVQRRRVNGLANMAVACLRRLMAQGHLTEADVDKMQRLIKDARANPLDEMAFVQLHIFIMELSSRRGPPPGASPMPAPVFPRGNPPSLSGAAEAPLD